MTSLTAGREEREGKHRAHTPRRLKDTAVSGVSD